MSPSTSPSRSSPNLQNFIDVLSPYCLRLRSGARCGVPPRGSIFLLELDRAHVGAVQILRILEDVRHYQVRVTVRLGDRGEPLGHGGVRAVRHAVATVIA